MLGIELADEAGRTAYLAAFHAAQALIFERTGRTPKTHQGVRTQFAKLARADNHFEIALRRFLTDAYDLKSIADYAIGPHAMVTGEDATEAVERAHQFVERVTSILR